MLVREPQLAPPLQRRRLVPHPGPASTSAVVAVVVVALLLAAVPLTAPCRGLDTYRRGLGKPTAAVVMVALLVSALPCDASSVTMLV